MNKYKEIKLPKIKDFNVPIYVDNRKRTKGTNSYFEEAKREASAFDKVNGLIVDKTVVDFVDCPVCHSKHKSELYLKWGFRIASCDNCKHVYVENQVKSAVLEKLYSISKLDVKFQERSEDKNFYKYEILFYNKYLQYIKKYFNDSENLLDIGAGDGKFLEFLNTLSNYRLSAMEFSKKSENFIKNIVGEQNFYNDPISQTHFNGKTFKIITIWGVLEHMPNPREELSKCKSILDDDGRILVLVPNFYSRALKIFGVDTPTINPRSHLQYYSYDSFEVLASNTGFEIDDYFQELPVIDLMYEHIDYGPELVKSILKENESYRSVYVLKHKE